MFSKLKDSLMSSNQNNDGNLYRNILKTEIDKTYVVRLLPSFKNPDQPILHHYVFSFNSFATNQLMIHVSPTSFGERDPVAEIRNKLYRTNKDMAMQIRRSEKWLINVYVVSDPTNPDNEGKVKILRYGKQLKDIIDEATIGDESDEYGARVLDLSPEGVNLKIKVTNQGGFPNFTSSKFTNPCAIAGMTEDRIQQVYEETYDLTEVLTIPTFDELEQRVKEHILCEETSPASPVKTEAAKPTLTAAAKEQVKAVSKPTPKKDDDDDFTLSDDDLADILPDLDDLD